MEQPSFAAARAPRRPAPRARTAARVGFLVACAIAFSLLGAPSALAISRDTVLARAQTWVDAQIPYSQTRYHGGYRTDCSGYVSMCWATGMSWTTATFHDVAHRISASELKPGDAMLKAGTHIRLFYGWLDPGHTLYVAYEQTGPHTVATVHVFSQDLGYGYVPYRYDRITDSPASSDLLLNNSFNTWVDSWSYGAVPAWWQVGVVDPDGSDGRTASAGDPPVTQTKKTYHSAHDAAEIVNATGDAAASVEMSQAVRVTPNGVYGASVWVRTGADPSSLRFTLSYLDASGAVLSEVSETGDRAGVGPTAFAEMRVGSTAPTGTVSAVIAVLLGGSTSASATVATATAYADDVSLSQAHTGVTIRTSATTARRGSTVTLAGSVTPASATVGVGVVLWVKRPGTTSWAHVATPVASGTSEGCVWHYVYHLAPTAHTGVYAFKAQAPAVAGYLASAARGVSVTVR